MTKIIKYNLKLNWKLLLLFITFWTIFALSIMFIFNLGNSKIFIAPTNIIIESGISGLQSLNFPLTFIIFGFPTIVLFSIFSISLNSITFTNEIKTGQISFWMTSPIKKESIYLGKIIYIFISLSFIYIVGLIPIFTFGILAEDSSKYFGLIIANSILFWLFLIALSSIFMLVSMITIEKGNLGLIINCCIITYILITWILTSLSKLNIESLKWAEFVKYISLQSLSVDLLSFSKAPSELNFYKEINYISGNHVSPNSAWLILSIFFNIIIIATITLVNVKIFKVSDLNI
ncbi:ABC transporter permease subunit [Mesoplasma coleopterae]|uniref:ABC transporter permease subunit n=1 Tax=Mesoplasma coleopterae TaxID=324078 RepID=UPI000D02EC79|nr:ABC transporter permease subunit [Mesoplasma coleopterae]AVN62999.1 hypothetical protein CG000_01620 [Mesoplasma coleopterae]